MGEGGSTTGPWVVVTAEFVALKTPGHQGMAATAGKLKQPEAEAQDWVSEWEVYAQTATIPTANRFFEATIGWTD